MDPAHLHAIPELPLAPPPYPPLLGLGLEELVASISALVERLAAEGQLSLPNPKGPAVVELRGAGRPLGRGLSEDGPWPRRLAAALRQAAEESPALAEVDTLLLCLGEAWQRVNLDRPGHAIANKQRGLVGIRLRHRRLSWLRNPFEALAENRSLSRYRELHHEACGLSTKAHDPGLRCEIHGGRQFMLQRQGAELSLEPLLRGGRLIEMAEVTAENIQQLACAQASWMLHNLHDDGRMTYKWWPSAGEESQANNMIRQFMATACLGRLAAWADAPSLRAAQERNMAYNFQQFYHEEEGLGCIEWASEGVKLGAIGLAALCLIERPDLSQYQPHLQALRRMLDHLHQPNGAFHTFYRPRARREQNQKLLSRRGSLGLGQPAGDPAR
ncbi:MAG: hypothetical protein EA402_12185 [Planctomycetota bacterium]|nr:MAG: hypothetical protein EA402_12185 [Planctomycetota bacterium]